MPTCKYTYPHKSRAAKVAYICSIGGYYDRHLGTVPIEFNVAAYRADFDFDHIWEKYASECMPHRPDSVTPDIAAAYYNLARKLHAENESYMWGWGQEDACRCLSDDDAYRTLYDGTQVAVEYGLYGRCGKHLVIVSFEGVSFRGVSSDDLRDMLMRQTRSDGYGHVEYDTLRKGAEWDYSTEFVDKLYRYVRQCEVDFTVDTASNEVEYCGATCFFHNIVNPAWEDCLKERATHAEVVEAAQAVREVMRHASASGEEMTYFATLCEAAQVSQEELG